MVLVLFLISCTDPLLLPGGVDVGAYLLRVLEESGEVRKVIPPIVPKGWAAFPLAFRNKQKSLLAPFLATFPAGGIEARRRLFQSGLLALVLAFLAAFRKRSFRSQEGRRILRTPSCPEGRLGPRCLCDLRSFS